MSVHRIGDFLKQLDVAGKSMSMYSENHPSAKQATDQAFALIQEFLKQKTTLTVSIIGSDLLVDGEVAERGDRALERFVKHLDARNIRSLSFHRSINHAELVNFLKVLNYVPQRIRDQGGMEAVLQKENITSIQANKVRYGIIGDGDAPTGGVAMSVDEGLLSQLLLTVQTGGTGAGEAHTAARRFEESLENSGSTDASAVLFRLFQNIAQGSSVDSTRPLRESFLDMFRSFTPKMQGKLLLTAVLNKVLLERSSLSGFYRDLRPEELDAPMTAVLLLEQVEDSELKLFAETLLEDPQVHLTDSIRQKMIQRGLIEPPAEAEAPPPPAPAAEALSPLELIRREIASGNLDEADRLSRKIIGGLTAAAAEQRRQAVETLPSLIEELLPHERWKNVEVSLSFVIANHFRKETETEVLAALGGYYGRVIARKFQGMDYAGCKETLALLGSRPEHQKVFADAVGSQLPAFRDALQRQLREGTAGAEMAMDLLQYCDSAGADFLLEWLAVEEDQRVRSKIIGLTEKLDQACLLPEMEKRLEDPRWYVVRNMVTITGRLNLPHAVPFMTRAMQNEDIRVAKEVVKALFKSISSSNAPLVLTLLQHPDKSIRLQALRLVTLFRLEKGDARPLLQKLASTDSVPEVRTLASSILG